MKLFLDSADISEIEEVLSYGILEGVTTNPSLIKKAAENNNIKKFDDYIEKILELCKGLSVSLEVLGGDYESMVREGKLLFERFNSVAENVYVKIPVNPCMELKCDEESDGIRAIRTLSELGIPVNCTLVFTPEQALLAAKAGADFVSPFVGRVDDYIRDLNDLDFDKKDYFPAEGMEKNKKILEDEGIVSGVDLIEEIAVIFANEGADVDILAASIRNKQQLREVAIAGADIATVPFDVIGDLLGHPKTIEGMKKFSADVIPEYAEIFGTKLKGGSDSDEVDSDELLL